MQMEQIQARAREIFRQEAGELLRELEAALLDLETNANDLEAVNRVFRVMHTLKGSGATSGYRELSTYVHRVEDVYNAAREGRLSIDEEIINLTLRISDVLERSLSAGPEEGAEVLHGAQDLLEALTARLKPGGKAEVRARAPVHKKWRLHFRAKPGLWKSGIDVGVFWDDLRALGPCKIEADTAALPDWNHFDPEECYLGWNIELDAEATEESIRDIFAFAGDDAEIRIEPVVDRPVETKPRVTTGDTLRVSSAKVDHLVNLVGELVILRAQLQDACSRLGEVPPALASAEEGLRRLAEEMREVVLEVRMMPVGDVFGKFRRVVRDLAQELGKEVDWVVEGGETEMDKTLLDQLADPLLHMVRNSLDHGIEPPADREAKGKRRAGTIRLRAEQRGDRVWISVRDDGRGLDPNKIRAKAIQKGLISENDARPDEELYELIFLPGFSTVDTVSQVSGRGVGMDVVRRGIEALRGAVELHSVLGQGTEVRMSLPLTLAIVDGLLVEVGGERYIVPLSLARETAALPPAEREDRSHGQVLEVRGEWIPYLRLRDHFAIPGARPQDEKVVVVQTETGTVGLVVDRVLGQHQTVLKSLGWLGQKVKVFSGGTVLGDGRVALVVDVPSLVAESSRRSSPSRPPYQAC